LKRVPHRVTLIRRALKTQYYGMITS